MNYNDNIRQVTDKNFLTFQELKDITIRMYGNETEDGGTIMSGKDLEKHIRSILRDENSFTAAISVENFHQLQNIFIWRYDVKNGYGILTEK
jgi:hypothetical protein